MAIASGKGLLLLGDHIILNNLTMPSLELLRNDKATQGLGFMHALIDYCAAGQEQEFSLAPFPQGGAARLRVLRRR